MACGREPTATGASPRAQQQCRRSRPVLNPLNTRRSRIPVSFTDATVVDSSSRGTDVLPPAERFVALFDVLGFKSIVSHNKLERVESAFRFFERQIQLSTTVPSIWGGQPLVQYRVFSDTVLAFTPNEESDSLEAMLWFCRVLLSAAFNTGLLLRGAVTRGPVVIDEHLYIGEPIVRAYIKEQSQEWVGCWVDDACFASIDPNSAAFRGVLLKYAVPLKEQVNTAGWVVAWADLLRPEIVTSQTEIENVFFAASSRTPEILAAVATKIANTMSFIQVHGPDTFTPPYRKKPPQS